MKKDQLPTVLYQSGNNWLRVLMLCMGPYFNIIDLMSKVGDNAIVSEKDQSPTYLQVWFIFDSKFIVYKIVISHSDI